VARAGVEDGLLRTLAQAGLPGSEAGKELGPILRITLGRNLRTSPFWAKMKFVLETLHGF
jgi:hypothetical protein